MLKVIVAATALSCMVCAAALAFPAPKSHVNVSEAGLVLVGKKHADHHHAYKHGYKHAPKGWKSYSYRPMFWERRGCIVIGPVWYCP